MSRCPKALIAVLLSKAKRDSLVSVTSATLEHKQFVGVLEGVQETNQLMQKLSCGLHGLWLLMACLLSSDAGFWKGPLRWQFFSLTLFLFGAMTQPRHRDTYISEPWQLHTYTNMQTHRECWLHGFCYQVLVHWSSSLLKNNERAVSQTGHQTATVCFPIT